MGKSESKERQLFIGIIMQLLNRREIKVKKTSVQSFSTFVQEQCPCFPEESSSPGFPYPPALHPCALSNEISCFVSTCVSSNNSFIRAQFQALEGVSLPATSCHFLLKGIFPIQGLNSHFLPWQGILYL